MPAPAVSRTGISLALVAVGVFVSTVLAVLRPRLDALDGCQAVFVLGPPTPRRLARAVEISERNAIDAILISVAEDQVVTLDGLDASEVVCATPHPFTTRGEAILLNGFVRARGFDRVVVVTFRPHVSRARFIFRRHFRGHAAFATYDEPLPWFVTALQLLYQPAALIKEIVTA
jgi:hypothetical protein